MLKNNKIRIFLTAIFLLLLCLVTYGDILSHQFMIDDYSYIRPDATIFVSYHHWGDFFKKTTEQHYAPFNLLLNKGLFHLFHEPLPLYLINLLLFYIDCGLLFVFVYFISKEFITAVLTCIIFCIHPMTGDILQHITFNILLVQAILMEAGLIFLYLYSQQNRHILYYFLSLLMVTLALLSQETALLFPIYAAALLFFLTDFDFKKIIKLVIPFAFLSLLLIVLWLLIVNPRMHLEHIKIFHPVFFWNACANFSRVFFWYLSNLFVPGSIVFMCNMLPLKGFILLWNLLFFGFWAGCGLLIFCCFKRSLESFALVLFLTGFIYAVPASLARFDHGGEWVFEPNWVYFSSIGFYLFIVLLLLKLRKYINKLLFIILLSALFIFYAAATFKLNIISRTEISYCENWLRQSPGNSIPTFVLKNFYMNNKDVDMPSDFIPDMLGIVDGYIKYDYPDKALALIERISSDKISIVQRKELRYRLAAYRCKYGDSDQCGEIIHRIIGPEKDPYTYLKLSYELYNYSMADKTAMSLLKECIDLYPKFKEPYLLMGVILANDGHYEESIDSWKQGLAIDPSDLRFVSNINEAKDLINKR